MAYFYDDWRHKKLTVEDKDGQFFLNFGEAEHSMINNLKDAIEKKDTSYMEYLVDCLEKRKVEIKWNIS